MDIFILNKNELTPKVGSNTIYLTINDWNDYSFITSFNVKLHDETGALYDLGLVKIGYVGQTEENTTYTAITEKLESKKFEQLPDNFFSLGQDVEYYQILGTLTELTRERYLLALKDIVAETKLLQLAEKEKVFQTSLLRNISLSIIKGQFIRVLQGGVPLTDFHFSFARSGVEKMADIEIDFSVIANSTPTTNIHAIIGRNGVGKTTLLNGMIEAITDTSQTTFKFYDNEHIGVKKRLIDKDYFSGLVSVSFSAFEPFDPPDEQVNPILGTCYYYIGLKTKDKKSEATKSRLKSLNNIYDEFADTLEICAIQKPKFKRWLKAINTLESDENFREMNLKELKKFIGVSLDQLKDSARKKIKSMSSGHMIVLLTITKLIATVEEKTLVLFDEPESHLHPPLLSALIRALSELLYDRNGIAIIATHSPVVLQEIPKFNVWKIHRAGAAVIVSRPDIETFGENVGILTREVFGLEVVKSGYHDLLAKSVEKGSSYQEIVEEYNGQLGLEARALLKALVMNRDRRLIDAED